MKIELHGAGRAAPITLLSRQALLEFRTETEVRGLLLQFGHDPINMHTLRSVLAQEGGGHSVAGLTDAQVIDRIAPIIARSCVGLVRTELLPVRSASSVGAESTSENPEQVFDSLLGPDSELEDPIPVPIVPPVFPVVATDEANTILGENRLYKLLLDMLRFVGLAGESESEVAEAYPKESSRSSSAIDNLAQVFSTELTPLGADANLLQAPSEKAQALSAINGLQRDVIDETADGASETLGGVLLGDRDPAAPSENAPALQSEGARAAVRVVDAADRAGVTLDALLQGEGNDPAPSTLGFTLRGNAAEQGESINAAADGQNETLDDLAKPAVAGDPPPDSEVAGAYTDAGGGQGERLGGSVLTAVDGLTDLLGRPAADVRALNGPGWAVAPEPTPGTRLTVIPEQGVYLVARSDGSEPLEFVVRTAAGIELAKIQPVVEDGIAYAHWAPNPIPSGPIHFDARTQSGLVRLSGAPATFGPEAVSEVDPNVTETGEAQVQAAGWTTRETDPRQGILEFVAPGAAFIAVMLSEPGLVRVSIFDDLFEPKDAAEPLTRFVASTDDAGLLHVPYDIARLPAGLRRVRVEVRDKADTVLFENVSVVVRHLAFSDAGLLRDVVLPPILLDDDPIVQARQRTLAFSDAALADAEG